MSGPICPWCKDEANERPDLLMFNDLLIPEDVESVCHGCDRPIVVTRTVQITYTARKRKKVGT